MQSSKIFSSHLILVSNVKRVSRLHRLVIKSLAVCHPLIQHPAGGGVTFIWVPFGLQGDGDTPLAEPHLCSGAADVKDG